MLKKIYREGTKENMYSIYMSLAVAFLQIMRIFLVWFKSKILIGQKKQGLQLKYNSKIPFYMA